MALPLASALTAPPPPPPTPPLKDEKDVRVRSTDSLKSDALFFSCRYDCVGSLLSEEWRLFAAAVAVAFEVAMRMEWMDLSSQLRKGLGRKRGMREEDDDVGDDDESSWRENADDLPK